MLLSLLYFLATFALSLGLSLYLTPMMIKGAHKYGVLDYPDGSLKSQASATPYLGGIAVYLAFLITLAVVFEFRPTLLGMLLGGTMVAMLGLFDDLKVISPQLKFAGQILAVVAALKGGILIEYEALPFWLAVGASAAWLLATINAQNIIDVSDGLSSGVASLSALGFFAVALIDGDTLIATTSLALSGACIGFLRYNQPTAQIYLGDTGSLFIGFTLGCLAIIGSYTTHSRWGLAAPVLIMSMPILDTSLVFFDRLRNRLSPFRGSPHHFALRLATIGWGKKRVAAYAYALALIGSVAGVWLTQCGPSTAPWLCGATGALFMSQWLWWLTLPVKGACASGKAEPTAA